VPDNEWWADRLNEASARSRPLGDEETDLDRLASDSSSPPCG